MPPWPTPMPIALEAQMAVRGIGASTSASSRPSSRSALKTRATASSVASRSVTHNDPTVTATPHNLLADGQEISVSATGFAPDTEMAIVECPTTEVSPSACDLATVAFAFTDANGAYADFQFTVSRILSDGTDCALNGGCYIGTQDAGASGPTASTLVTFDPDIPAPTVKAG